MDKIRMTTPLVEMDWGRDDQDHLADDKGRVTLPLYRLKDRVL